MQRVGGRLTRAQIDHETQIAVPVATAPALAEGGGDVAHRDDDGLARGHLAPAESRHGTVGGPFAGFLGRKVVQAVPERVAIAALRLAAQEPRVAVEHRDLLSQAGTDGNGAGAADKEWIGRVRCFTPPVPYG